MTETAIRGAYFLNDAIVGILCKNYALTASFEDISGLRIPIYYVNRPWTRKFILGPYNLVADYLGITEEIVAAIIGLANESGAAASLRVYGDISETLKSRGGLQSTIDSFETIILTEGGLDSIYSRMRPRFRNKILHLIEDRLRSNVSIRRFNDKKTLKEFYCVLIDTYLKRHKMLPPPYQLLEDLVSCREAAAHAFGYVAEMDDRVLGGILIMADPAQWIYAWGATDVGAMGLDVSSLLLHRAIEDAIELQIPQFSLGITPVSHTGLAQYKRGWSKVERPAGYATVGAPPPNRDPHTSFRTARMLIANLPKPAIRMLSPLIYRMMA